jgi:hypothetical protein
LLPALRARTFFPSKYRYLDVDFAHNHFLSDVNHYFRTYVPPFVHACICRVVSSSLDESLFLFFCVESRPERNTILHFPSRASSAMGADADNDAPKSMFGRVFGIVRPLVGSRARTMSS